MADLTPIARVEHFLARIAGLPAKILSPKTRIEMFLQRIIDNGGTGPGGEVTPASIVSATGQMTEEQAAQTRENLNAASSARQLPVVSASDNDKFLRVVSGAWAAATVPSAETASF